ncbi:MAG TPA: hypothetical protein VMT47_01255 [Polyangia bacterium]|nr:hypothetical protein [Polyangia bacterium]
MNAARGACHLALEVGDYGVAREACDRTFLLGGTPEDMRNRVASLVSGPRPPTMDDLAMAVLVTQANLRTAPGQPWAYLAKADVARSLGDREMLDGALGDLQRVAPGDPLTIGALAQARQHVSPWIWLGRIAFVLFLLATGAHAASRSRRLGLRRRSQAAAAVALALVTLGGHGVRAENPQLPPEMSVLPIDDANPISSVPTLEGQMKNPLAFGYFLQDLLARAQKAAGKGDHVAAARYYGALTKAVPTRAYAYTKLCDELLTIGDRKLALRACHEALFKEGVTVSDYKRYVRLVLAGAGPLSDEDHKNLDAVLAHLDSDPTSAVVAQANRCEFALRAHDVPALEACTAALVKSAPNDATAISFEWALAVERREPFRAWRLIGRARAAGIAQAGLDEMWGTTRGLLWPAAGRIVFWLLAFVALAVIVVRRLSRRARGLRRTPAPPIAPEATGAEGR